MRATDVLPWWLRRALCVTAIVHTCACADGAPGAGQGGDAAEGFGPSIADGSVTPAQVTPGPDAAPTTDGRAPVEVPAPPAAPAVDARPTGDATVDARPAAEAGAAACGKRLPPGDHAFTLMVDGQARRYDVHVPPGAVSAAPPVLLWFHPLTTNKEYGKGVGLPAKSDREGFLAVFPDGVGGSWNAGACCGQAVTRKVDDVAFVRAVVRDLSGRTCVDEARIYAAGFSNGGFLSHRLACEASDLIAAIAADAGVIGVPGAACKPVRPVPVLQIHGTADAIIGYGGSAGPVFGVTNGGFPGAPETVKGWAARNGCVGAPVETLRKGKAHCEAHTACPGGAEVTLCTVEGGGHCWFGEPSCPLGPNSADLNATDVAWAFLRRFSRAP